MPAWKKVAAVAEIPPGTAKAVELDGKKVAVFNVDGNYYAIGDTCTHRGGPLSEGDVEEHQVTCPWHGATFDLKTGSVTGPPASQNVPQYKVQVEGSDINIEL